MNSRILAIDTSTEACSVALGLGRQTYCRFTLEPRKHAELVLPMVREVLTEADITLAELDALAFARGPGAFTGLRIAAGIVQGLAFGAGLPVLSVSSLAAMAHRAWREHDWQAVHVAIDARMAEVYWGSFRIDTQGVVSVVGEEVVCAPALVASHLPAMDGGADRDWAGIGTGWIHEAVLREQTGLTGPVWNDCLPHALDVLALAQRGWECGEARDAVSAQPVYLRDNVVQVRQPG